MYPAAQQHRRDGRALPRRVADLRGRLPPRWPRARRRRAGRNPDWARTLKGAIDASLREAGRGREASIQAAIDYFYTGPVASSARRVLVEQLRSPTTRARRTRGLLSLEDFADYGTRGTQVEEPVRVTYRGIEVLKCGPWTQGPVFLQQLKLLEGYDLAALGHNTAEYLHIYLECAKLAFADRERYYGDPEFATCRWVGCSRTTTRPSGAS